MSATQFTPGRDVLRPARTELPEEEMEPEAAYRLIHDELMLDGNARLNLATFATSWMEPQARALMNESLAKNAVDREEYPQTAAMEERCVRMLARLWHAPTPDTCVGCSTTGSSEAAMLAGLVLKRRWQQRRRASGSACGRPNLVMGANVQVCWKKFARYFDVEPRLVPLETGQYHLTQERLARYCDQNTIGVVSVLGSTLDGSYEPVDRICAALDALEGRTGMDIPVHVDGASGAMVAPFLDPDLAWDFRLDRVVSINASGHKYGLVYPSIGWAIWRDTETVPEDLIFQVNYLGGHMPTLGLSFSRPASQVAAQYYSFLRYGRAGLRRAQGRCRAIAQALAAEIATIGPFRLLSDGSQLPVIAFCLAPDTDNFTVFDVSRTLRERGWQVPAYTLPKNREDLAVLRVVVRHGFSGELAQLFLDDLQRVTDQLAKQAAPANH
ncbi:glutamate decarboxylase [Streptomyces sp. RB6PN25]|uniref:Glutamate decarboxylase n=1 Tax=Streptomyces humicola TaxID=2953240 RepID=A0ABT1PTE6_9ACTN|nr:glutamate decarboxylase [Streptomyces humicola]MCQ4080949.1 glutamate decarboxylase [Streptomyces humicola]